MFSIEVELVPLCGDPKGGNQALSIRIRGRGIFSVVLTSHEKQFSLLQCDVFNWISGYLRCVEPEGGKSSALYQNPGSTHFNVFSTSNEELVSYKMLCFKSS